jgi:DHA1 family tetracycline resistance protein-like MFS transporter
MLYGLATHGWMMYVFILCNLLAFAAGPALQGILSKTTGPGEQGELMGSLQSVGSLGVILMPLLGTALLGAASHLPAQDWRVGGPFFLCAAMQAVAIVVAHRYFRSHNKSPTRA